MKKQLLLSLSIVAILITSIACKKATNSDDVCKDAVCTMEFRSIMITVVDANNQPVIMDDYYTIRVGTNDTLRSSTIPLNAPPSKTVLDDNYLPQFKNQRDLFRFIGFYQNKLVVDHSYTISADCCHIKKELGADTVLTK